MNFAERLKKIRTSKGCTQKDLAAALHLGENAISNYERGNRQPDIETIIEIAKKLDVSVDYLIGFSDINIKPRLMQTHFIKGITVETFLDKALQLDASHRKTVYTVLSYAQKDQYIRDGNKETQ